MFAGLVIDDPGIPVCVHDKSVDDGMNQLATVHAGQGILGTRVPVRACQQPPA